MPTRLHTMTLNMRIWRQSFRVQGDGELYILPYTELMLLGSQLASSGLTYAYPTLTAISSRGVVTDLRLPLTLVSAWV